MTDKILYKDIVPYEVPSSLDALRGPASGEMELPITVHWGPKRVFDLDNPSELVFAYRQIVREGTPEDQEELLNTDLLRKVWSEIWLPERCARLWKTKFPELAEP